MKKLSERIFRQSLPGAQRPGSSAKGRTGCPGALCANAWLLDDDGTDRRAVEKEVGAQEQAENREEQEDQYDHRDCNFLSLCADFVCFLRSLRKRKGTFH